MKKFALALIFVTCATLPALTYNMLSPTPMAFQTAAAADNPGNFGIMAPPPGAIAKPVAIGGPIGSPAYVVAPPPQSSVIDIGAAFGWLAPYVNAVIGMLITTGLSWLGYWLQQRLKIHIDEGNRNALQTALLNAASSLIADGLVKLEGVKVTVPSDGLANAVSQVAAAVPGALAHFGITPDVVAAKIIDKIPQVPAGAQMIAAVNKAT